jgi:23S rRNA (uracil1939-C5)-methyltransferase
LDQTVFTIKTESLNIDSNAIGHRDGKVVFVRGALAGETVTAQLVRIKPKFDTAQMIEVLRENVSRVTPRCPHFGVCGGCSMQHLEPRAQVSVKQRVLEDNLWHLGKVKPETMLAPIVGNAWGYRFRARLSVRYVTKKGKVLVGFHEKGSSYVADMSVCHVMPTRVSELLLPLRALVEQLSIRDRLPQIEIAYSDDPIDGQIDTLAMVLRIMAPLSDEDQLLLTQFARARRVEFWLQHKSPDDIVLFEPSRPSTLAYRLPEFDVTMPFKPTDFTQVNHHINQVLVGRAIRLLDPQPKDRVLDLFCGLGNFTLPLARRSAQVIGIEGSSTLISRAAQNAKRNGLQERTKFSVENLFEFTHEKFEKLGQIDRMLIDPPRDGALAVASVLAKASITHPYLMPKRIVYVSCNPATLARDCATLVHEGRWQLKAAGVVNMFAHTAHVESMAVLEPTI